MASRWTQQTTFTESLCPCLNRSLLAAKAVARAQNVARDHRLYMTRSSVPRRIRLK